MLDSLSWVVTYQTSKCQCVKFQNWNNKGKGELGRVSNRNKVQWQCIAIDERKARGNLILDIDIQILFLFANYKYNFELIKTSRSR